MPPPLVERVVDRSVSCKVRFYMGTLGDGIDILSHKTVFCASPVRGSKDSAECIFF